MYLSFPGEQRGGDRSRRSERSLRGTPNEPSTVRVWERQRTRDRAPTLNPKFRICVHSGCNYNRVRPGRRPDRATICTARLGTARSDDAMGASTPMHDAGAPRRRTRGLIERGGRTEALVPSARGQLTLVCRDGCRPTHSVDTDRVTRRRESPPASSCRWGASSSDPSRSEAELLRRRRTETTRPWPSRPVRRGLSRDLFAALAENALEVLDGPL